MGVVRNPSFISCDYLCQKFFAAFIITRQKLKCTTHPFCFVLLSEVHQLQWELSRRDVERAALSNELAALTAQVEMQDKQLAALGNLRTEYDALLLLYGEKLEESQELRMDLQDVKDMYKTQIDQLLKKEPNS
ncbi:TATA element modulatory factor 1 [Homalodisca vitripennis]|nr:TATA element modulatory factor 1 [Homalodisca vitripennis]